MKTTYADISALEKEFGYRPKMKVAEGLARFVACYQEYYDV